MSRGIVSRGQREDSLVRSVRLDRGSRGREAGGGWRGSRRSRPTRCRRRGRDCGGRLSADVAEPRSVSLEGAPRGGSIVLQAKTRGVVSVSVRSSGVGARAAPRVLSASPRHLPPRGAASRRASIESISRGGSVASLWSLAHWPPRTRRIHDDEQRSVREPRRARSNAGPLCLWEASRRDRLT